MSVWRRTTQRVIALSPRAVLVTAFAVFLVWAFPGYMSTDSEVQLMEARAGVFSNAHPPLMAAEWRLLDAFVTGPLLMLLLQGTLFLGGLYVIFRRFVAPKAAAWIASGILLYPPVLTVMAVIWKDSQMAAYAVAGVAALLQPRLRTRLIGLGLLVLAASLRHNAAAGIAPLVFFLFEWRGGMGWGKRIAIAIVAVAITVGAMFGLTRALTSTAIKLTPAFQDVVGVIAFMDDTPDDELKHTLRGVPLLVEEGVQARARYLYELGGAFRITQGDEAFMLYPRTPEQWQALQRAWWELITSEPRAYVAMHWNGFAKILGLTAPTRTPVYNLFLENGQGAIDGIGHNAGPSLAQLHGGRVLYWLAERTPLFRPWVYAAIALLLLVLFVRDRLTAALIASGLLYELSFFPFSADPDYRYSHWMITSIVIATVIVFLQRRGATPNSQPLGWQLRFAITPLRIVVLGWVAFLLYAWPGFLDVAAADMLLDARAGELTDWHSPMLVQVWQLVGVVVGGPPAMVMLHSGLFVFGGFTLLRRVLQDRAAAVAIVAVLLFPPVMSQLAVVTSDAALGAFLVAAAAAFTSERRAVRLVGLGAALVACGVREGAAVAALPVVVAGFVWSPSDGRIKRHALAAAAWVGCALLAAALVHALPAKQTRVRDVARATVDIVGIVAHAEPIADAALRELAPRVRWYGTELQQRARRVVGWPSRFARGADRVLEPWDSEDTDALVDARAALIRAYPRAYLASRWTMWRRLVTRTKGAVYTDDVAVADHRAPVQHGGRPSALQKLVHRGVRALGKTPLFTPWAYLVVAVVLLPLALWRRQRVAATLLASGLAMAAALLVVTWDIQYRYLAWPIAATVLAVALMLRGRAAPPPASS